MPGLEERVDTLESILGQFIIHTDVALKRLENEMRVFKDEMGRYRREQDEEWRKWRKEWSNIAKKMGTIVDDLIAPALRSTLSKYFGCDVSMEGQRLQEERWGEL